MWEVGRACYFAVAPDASAELYSAARGDGESNGNRRTSGDGLPDRGPATMPAMSPPHDDHFPAIAGSYLFLLVCTADVHRSDHWLDHGILYVLYRGFSEILSKRKRLGINVRIATILPSRVPQVRSFNLVLGLLSPTSTSTRTNPTHLSHKMTNYSKANPRAVSPILESPD